jgi:hypothetical protein
MYEDRCQLYASGQDSSRDWPGSWPRDGQPGTGSACQPAGLTVSSDPAHGAGSPAAGPAPPTQPDEPCPSYSCAPAADGALESGAAQFLVADRVRGLAQS